MAIKRIQCPKFRIGRYKLNEYELRYLMLTIAEGDNQEFIGRKVTDCTSGESAVFLPNGRLKLNRDRFSGLSVLTEWSMLHMEIVVKQNSLASKD